ncbi:serine hydrolase [Latilactobacillus fuchuensis]|uniref:serine-type D-Ala-D-Ala carboxypeptidase n=1 Tax=Latilactobacillus fuchuensis TaxID=164393 RepID=A0A2N9DYD5_9LACO|nr:serine hydrolase [Latilactobacillus fuchuensis]MCP8856980.1 D-alanyl-D-alanine carboxypeptidase [Latilactobacillus fuchuensis]SPC40162.1 D-alanyl-D-alanine carboxypeptidase dacA [Latilactobacillus fuchuensis]
MFKKIIQYLMVGLLVGAPASLAVQPTISQAATTTPATLPTAPQIDASAAIAVDAKSGQVLFEQNADQALPIASMTKMITAYIVLTQIKQGKLKWEQTIKPDTTIYKLSQDKDLTNVPLQAEGQYTVRELYQAMMIASANDAAMMLANAIAGSQKDFVDLMRQQVSQWGITDAKLYSVSGLNNAYLTDAMYSGSAKDAENEMSAVDMAIVAQKLLADFPDVLDTTKQATFTFGPQTSDETKLTTFNLMLPGQKNAPTDYVVDGLKTGTTDKAGDCFTGTATKDGQRIITVVMHANGSDTGRRFIETGKLMTDVFDNWAPQTLAKSATSIAGYQNATVKYGRQATVPLVTNQTITLWLPKGATSKNVDWQYQAVKGGNKRQVQAPIKKGTTVGQVSPQLAGTTTRFLKTQPTYSLKTQKADPKANVFVLIGMGVKEFFTDLF